MSKEPEILPSPIVSTERVLCRRVLILGPNLSISEATLHLYRQPGYLLIGDGTQGLSSLSLAALQDNIGPATKIDIYAHGMVRDRIHSIDNIVTSNFLSRLAGYCGRQPLHVHLHSCFAGAAAPDVSLLPVGSALICHGEGRETTTDINVNTIFESNRVLNYDLTAISKIEDFAEKLLINVKQTATISIRKADGSIFKHTIHTPEHLISNPDEIVRYFESQRSDFIKKYNEEFKSNKIDARHLSPLKSEDAIEWKKDNFLYLSMVGDISLVEAIRQNPNGFADCLNYKTYRGYSAASLSKENKKQNTLHTELLKARLETFSINPTEIEQATSIWGKYGTKAMEYVCKAYDNVLSPDHKLTKAREAFDKVKEASNMDHFKLLVDGILTLEQLKNARCFSNAPSNLVMTKYLIESYGEGSEFAAIDMFDYLKDLDNPYHIEAVWKYTLKADQVKVARCFSTTESSLVALESIKTAFETSDKSGAQLMFDRIKGLDNPYHIEAVCKIDLNPNKVKSALCFSNPESSLVALKYLKDVYVVGSEFVAMDRFDDIMGLDNPYKITAVCEYGLRPEDVACFNNSKALDHIKQAYEGVNGTTQDKEAAAKKAVLAVKSMMDLDLNGVNLSGVSTNIPQTDDGETAAQRIINSRNNVTVDKESKL